MGIDREFFEIALVIPIALFCLIFVVFVIISFVFDTVEFLKKFCGRSFKEKVTEQLTEIEQKLSDLTIETECNYDCFETLRQFSEELEDRLKHLEQKKN